MNTGFDITNEDRAQLALTAVKAFAEATGQDNDQPDSITSAALADASNEGWQAREIVGDMLCNLMHLLGKDLFELALQSGYGHFEAELCRFCGGTAEDYGVCDDCGPLRCSRCDGLLTSEPCAAGHQAWM
jgi:hypothetical protein